MGSVSAARAGERPRTGGVERTQKLDTLLEKKFEEARKKAKDNPDEKRHNPMDWD